MAWSLASTSQFFEQLDHQAALDPVNQLALLQDQASLDGLWCNVFPVDELADGFISQRSGGGAQSQLFRAELRFEVELLR